MYYIVQENNQQKIGSKNFIHSIHIRDTLYCCAIKFNIYTMCTEWMNEMDGWNDAVTNKYKLSEKMVVFVREDRQRGVQRERVVEVLKTTCSIWKCIRKLKLIAVQTNKNPPWWTFGALVLTLHFHTFSATRFTHFCSSSNKLDAAENTNECYMAMPVWDMAYVCASRAQCGSVQVRCGFLFLFISLHEEQIHHTT